MISPRWTCLSLLASAAVAIASPKPVPGPGPRPVAASSHTPPTTLYSRQEEFDPENPREREFFCKVAFHQSTMVGSTMYIEGGFALLSESPGIFTPVPNMYVRTIDTSVSFTIESKSEVPVKYIRKPDLAPDLTEGALWPWGQDIYHFGGRWEFANESYPGMTEYSFTNELWKYTPTTNEWKADISPLVTINGERFGRAYSGLSAVVPSLKKAFYLGGESYEAGEVMGMMVYDLEEQTFERKEMPYEAILNGNLVHIPVGEKGVLLAFSGRSFEEPMSMSQISVFNLETMEFASGWQLATPSNLTKEDEFDDSLPGLPKSRENSCAVVASAKDGSSHNIYIFGGVEYQSDGNFNHETGTYGDVWVLSIPSFEWFKVYSPPTRGSPNSAAPTNRKGHTCELVGDRVMMVYGGYSESNEAQAATCDQTGVFAFDLTKLEWMEKYEPDLGQYKVPKQIYSVIGGGPDGGAKLMPQGGLRDDAVNKMFVDAMASLTSEPTGSPTDLDANPDSDTNPDSDAPDAPIGDDTEKGKGNAGAIAGGVVGALVGVALVAGLVFFFLRSRKQRRDLVELSGAEYAPPVEIDSTKPPVEMQSPDQQYDGYYTPAKVELNAHSEATHELPAQFA